MSRIRWFVDKLGDIIVDLIGGIILYLILGGYISQPLSAFFPQLPSILVVALVLAIVLGLSYRFYKSVRFHRFVEKNYGNLVEFLHNWDKLHDSFNRAINSRNEDRQAVREFEDTRTMLVYEYPKISSVAKMTSYDYIDHIRGYMIKNYDVIGNFIAKSPFTRMEWFSIDFDSKDFYDGWDSGRTVLISTIGFFDCYRQTATHTVYWVLHLVPITKKNES